MLAARGMPKLATPCTVVCRTRAVLPLPLSRTDIHAAPLRLPPTQVDLPSQLGLDLVHCERAADAVVAASSGGIQLAQGELFSSAYFDGLAAEVDEGLQEAGVVSGARRSGRRHPLPVHACVIARWWGGEAIPRALKPSLLLPLPLPAVGDLARRFGLGAEMIGGVLGERVGTRIHGRMDAGVIYTQAYLTRIKAQLRWGGGGWWQGSWHPASRQPSPLLRAGGSALAPEPRPPLGPVRPQGRAAGRRLSRVHSRAGAGAGH